MTVPLTMSEGNIWGAIVLDYAYHSFSHIGVYYGKLARVFLNVIFLTSQAMQMVSMDAFPTRIWSQLQYISHAGSVACQSASTIRHTWSHILKNTHLYRATFSVRGESLSKRVMEHQRYPADPKGFLASERYNLMSCNSRPKHEMQVRDRFRGSFRCAS